MKYIKSYILFVLMGLAVTGCTMDDLKDDVNDLKDRVTLIEQQVKLLNDNLAVISYILDPQNKTISNVKKEGQGENQQYVITLSNGDQLTLTIGKEGTVNEPEITIGEDGKWYINGTSTGVTAVGENGKNGEGYPEFRVQDGNWQVRFGDGAWANVPGGEGIAGGSSLGDQIFESAKVEGNNFVVTLKDGTVHTLPIVATLVCTIDRTGLTFDDEDFLVINKGERTVIPVKIEGEKMQVTYPEGWRATLNKLDVADEKGNNYQLFIFAPSAETKALTRAAADNTADVTVQVQKGAFWAVDKIKVKNPRDYSNNLNKYEDGMAVTVGGFDIKKEEYGAATEITADQSITQGGVYFVSTNNVTLTYNLGSAGVTDLIILPTTADVTTINLSVSSQIYFKGTIACQNVVLNNKVSSSYPLRVSENDVKVVFVKCKLMNLVVGKGMIMPNTNANPERIGYFEITDTDIKLDNAGANTYLVTGMDCTKLVFNNNIVYYSKDVPQDTNAFTATANDTNGHLTQFKVYSANTKTLSELIMNNNTFVDVEANGTSGLVGLVWASEVKNVEIYNNLYWLSFPATVFKSGANPQTKIVMLRLQNTPLSVATGGQNYIYSGNPAVVNFSMSGSAIPAGLAEIISTEVFFDTSDQTTFNKSTGTFIPKAGYTQYGAQR